MPETRIEYSAPRALRIAAMAMRLGLVAAITGLAVVSALAADPVPVEAVGGEYARPQQRIDVGGGRHINLHCMGEGQPTVVFESGLSDWSNTWALIQPAVAKRTRACSYDRAGMGYSDPSPDPRTPEAVVADLARLLDGAGIHEPVLLVGHSLGGFYAKLFAATRPGRVAGLVLVDPSEERLWDRVGDELSTRYGPALVRNARKEAEGVSGLIAHFGKCARKARGGGLDDSAYRRCTDPERTPLGEAILADRRVLQATESYQDTQWRELRDSMYGEHPEADARYARLFSGPAPLGDLPLLVLTHGLWDLSDATSEVHYRAWRRAHEQTAALSRRGTQEMVPMSHHNLQVERPQAVIDAVERVLRQVRDTR